MQYKYRVALIASIIAIVASGWKPVPGGSEQRPVRNWEAEVQRIPDPVRLREYMKTLSAYPHHVGSPHDARNAEWILSKFREWGLDAHIEKFDVLMPTPKVRLLDLVSPTRFTASLTEPILPSDPSLGDPGSQLPTYNAYSADGDVTAPLVYVNYGIPEDYEQLERMGISVKGAIVIARYGASWRGIKPKVAAEHGALGCIIYSDPSGDGFWQGDVYPGGPWRSRDGVQRGSVMDMPLYPGDPLTPGVGAVPGAKRLALKDVNVFTKIPVLPISYADAQPLLAALAGRIAPEKWRGALPITYHIGPGPAKVHLHVESNWDTKTISDVIARIPGSTYPDEWVIRGNHHDAWVYGAEDPISGLVAELEEARALGLLLREGWKPKRTVIYCAWDGEEEGLLGSTEWAETHADELRQHAAMYINSDGNGRGYLGVAGSHSLERFIDDVARDITDPETRMSVLQRSKLRRIADAATADDRKEIRERGLPRIGALGSGSDYTVFIDHLGIASLNLGFGGEDGGGIYHSIYDDFSWFTRFSDTSFVYERALAQTAGTAIVRFADAEILPYDFTGLSSAVGRYLKELQKLSEKMRDDITERNMEIEEGVFAATADPRIPSVPPKPEAVPPFLNFAPMENAAAALKQSVERYQKSYTRFLDSTRAVPGKLNGILIQTERALTSDEGLPKRPWFKHQIYAPGLYTGYGVKTIPGVREAIEQKEWNEANEQIARVALVLDRESKMIDSASTELESSMK